jgi:hypothetical protein
MEVADTCVPQRREEWVAEEIQRLQSSGIQRHATLKKFVGVLEENNVSIFTVTSNKEVLPDYTAFYSRR